MRRITRDNYRVAELLEMVASQTDTENQEPEIDRLELLRLIEESAHAYLRLRDEARQLFNALAQASIFLSKDTERLLWPKER